MKISLKAACKLWLAFVLCIAIMVLTVILNDEQKYHENPFSSYDIQLMGEYQVDGSQWTEIPLDGILNLRSNHWVHFVGNFDKDIPYNRVLTLRVDNNQLVMFINGEL